MGGRGITIDVLVQPRASRNEVLGTDEAGRMKVRVTAPPVEGAANECIVDLLSRHFGVPKRNIAIVSGERGRRKKVRIAGLEG